MTIEAMERELAELKQRIADVESKVDVPARQRWRSAVGTIKPSELTRQAAKYGEEWRAGENKRR